MSIVQNQMLKQECEITGYNMTVCADLTKSSKSNFTQDIESEIQPKIADVSSAITMLNSFFPPIYSLFLGAWSDKFGRKPIMMMSFIGYSSTLVLFAIISFLSDNIGVLSPWVFFYAELPMCLLGGWPLLDVAACCYVTDISEKSKHAIRLGTIGFINLTMNFVGHLSASSIYEATSASTVFIISFCSCISGLILLICIVDESIPEPQDNSTSTRIRNIVSWTNINGVLETLFKRREKSLRKILWYLIPIAILAVFTMHGNGTVGYLFGRKKFNWGMREYNVYDATNTAITALGIFVGLTLFKKIINVPDVKLGLLTTISAIIEAVWKAFANTPVQMYLASCIGVLRVLVNPVYRSVMTNTYDKQEIGKIFSSATAMEAFSGMAAGPLYSSVYKATIDTWPGAFHLITAIVFGIMFILGLLILRHSRKIYIAEKLHENEQEIINRKEF